MGPLTTKQENTLHFAAEAAKRLAPLGVAKVRLMIDGDAVELDLCGLNLDPAMAMSGREREKGVVPDAPDDPLQDPSTFGADPDDPDAKPPHYTMHDEPQPDDIGGEE